MIIIKMGSGVSWEYPTHASEVCMGDYIRFCELSETSEPQWFREIRASKGNVRMEKEMELRASVDKQVELLNYLCEVICVFAREIGKSPKLTPQILKGSKQIIDGKEIMFNMSADNLRELWDNVDGGSNIFTRFEPNNDSIFTFEYKGSQWGIDSPFMRNSKLVEYVEGRFWADVFSDSEKGVFGKALSKIACVLIREYDGEKLKEVDVDDFTESEIHERELFFSELRMDNVMNIGFFLRRHVASLGGDLQMLSESLRQLKSYRELMAYRQMGGLQYC